MWKEWKSRLEEKVDVKVTGYISVGIFALSVILLLWLVGLSAAAAGELAEWAAAAGIAIILVNAWSIVLAKWGQAQTGRKLKLNRTAVWLNRAVIAVMAVIYVLGMI